MFWRGKDTLKQQFGHEVQKQKLSLYANGICDQLMTCLQFGSGALLSTTVSKGPNCLCGLLERCLSTQSGAQHAGLIQGLGFRPNVQP